MGTCSIPGEWVPGAGGDPDQAIVDLKAAVAQDAQPERYFHLAQAYQKKDPAEAVRLMRKAVDELNLDKKICTGSNGPDSRPYSGRRKRARKRINGPLRLTTAPDLSPPARRKLVV